MSDQDAKQEEPTTLTERLFDLDTVDPETFGLEDILRMQREYQSLMGNPLGQPGVEGEKIVKEAQLAIVAEVGEVLDEINWKPWRKKVKTVDRERVLREMCDQLQFWCNAISGMGFTMTDVRRALYTKWGINKRRFKANY